MIWIDPLRLYVTVPDIAVDVGRQVRPLRHKPRAPHCGKEDNQGDGEPFGARRTTGPALHHVAGNYVQRELADKQSDVRRDPLSEAMKVPAPKVERCAGRSNDKKGDRNE